MEDFDILNKFDNDKLIDIVKNYNAMVIMMHFVIMLSIY